MNSTPDKMVEMRGVELKFADKAVLDGVDFSVRAEEVLVIMGFLNRTKGVFFLRRKV